MAVAVALVFVPAASSDGGSGFLWRVNSVPFTVSLDSHLSDPALQADLVPVAADWSQSSVVDVLVGGSGRRKISLYEGFYGASQPWAWISFSLSGGYLSGATIFMNDTYLATTTDFAKRQILCHEVGHGLGLAHQPDPASPSCLAPSWPGASPNAYDYQQLGLIY